MGKNTEIKSVGQPIFKQIMNMVDKAEKYRLIRKQKSDYYSFAHLFFVA